MIPVSKTLETDIAVVGGGIGGLWAAIAAAEGGTGSSTGFSASVSLPMP